MIAADRPQSGSQLLSLDAVGRVHLAQAIELPRLLHRGDLVIANDAATLPASLRGSHIRTGAVIEVRLAGKIDEDPTRFIAVVFGAGNYRTRTEHRALPPALASGDRLMLGPLTARVECHLDHPRLVAVKFAGSEGALWAGLASHGRPIQYAHVPEPLNLWDVWTKVACAPLAFESPSAGFVLTSAMLASFAERGIGFATLTHAAGISSTGDEELDRRLPFDEAYEIPASTAAAIRRTKAEGGRIIAVGTSVVRALEHACGAGIVRSGRGVATNRLGPDSELKLVDAIVSGVHAAGESHYELLRAFADDADLQKMTELLEVRGFRNHEFGDFVMIERSGREVSRRAIAEPSACVRYSMRGHQEELRS